MEYVNNTTEVKICRICCQNNGVSYIFCDSEVVAISSKIMICCCNIKVSKDDGLPGYICEVCERELDTCYSFILKCESSDKKLRSKQNNASDIKLEPQVKTEGDVNGTDDMDYIFDDSLLPLDDLKQELEVDNKEILKREMSSSKKGMNTKRKKQSKYKRPNSKCSVCGRNCSSPSALVIHLRSHSVDKPYPCSKCDKKYKDASNLKKHISRKHLEIPRERNFICETCGKGFYCKNDVIIHIRTHTGETPYSCPLCSKKFTQLSAMQRHKRRHDKEKTAVCSICSKGFCTREELKGHMLVHSTEKKYPCPVCKVMFKYQNNVKKHMILHSDPKSFICNYCGRTFNTKGNLKIHIDKLHSEKSGFCSLCCKHVPNMEVHMWKHTNQRPLKCELCTSSFFELRALAHHMNFRHRNIDKYKCEVAGCLLTFPSKPMLDFHTAKLHSNLIPFPCNRCSRGFYRKNDLARHMIGTHKERLSS